MVETRPGRGAFLWTKSRPLFASDVFTPKSQTIASRKTYMNNEKSIESAVGSKICARPMIYARLDARPRSCHPLTAPRRASTCVRQRSHKPHRRRRAHARSREAGARRRGAQRDATHAATRRQRRERLGRGGDARKGRDGGDADGELWVRLGERGVAPQRADVQSSGTSSAVHVHPLVAIHRCVRLGVVLLLLLLVHGMLVLVDIPHRFRLAAIHCALVVVHALLHVGVAFDMLLPVRAVWPGRIRRRHVRRRRVVARARRGRRVRGRLVVGVGGRGGIRVLLGWRVTVRVRRAEEREGARDTARRTEEDTLSLRPLMLILRPLLVRAKSDAKSCSCWTAYPGSRWNAAEGVS
ncbi:hypothetical protein C8R46DRAFT_1087902 [Mycena filopes]|nr:hypothetical protein C8R46DRAFT_1087902 [Mycena filopes]